jgi:hypothetical protein
MWVIGGTFAVSESLYVLGRPMLTHDFSSAFRTFWRARVNRDVTVPIGMESVWAISL